MPQKSTLNFIIIYHYEVQGRLLWHLKTSPLRYWFMEVDNHLRISPNEIKMEVQIHMGVSLMIVSAELWFSNKYQEGIGDEGSKFLPNNIWNCIPKWASVRKSIIYSFHFRNERIWNCFGGTVFFTDGPKLRTIKS